MIKQKKNIARKVSKYGVFSAPYFPAFGLNTERYSVSPYSVEDLKNGNCYVKGK